MESKVLSDVQEFVVFPESAEESPAQSGPSEYLSERVRHRLRNELHAIRIGLNLYRQEMAEQALDEAEVTYRSIVESLDRLAADPVLHSPPEN